VRRRKADVIDPKSCVCCLAAVGAEDHHKQPKSQNGSDDPDNIARVCEKCHVLYNVNNKTLAKTPKARARNFALWIALWPGVSTEMCGKRHGPNPWVMAPDWVIQEYSDYSTGVEVTDLSNGCLSRIGTVSTMYPIRKHLLKGDE